MYEDTLKAAIASNSKAVHFRVLLARYYKDAGRTAEAKAQYDAAIAKARELGNTTLATQLEAERSSF